MEYNLHFVDGLMMEDPQGAPPQPQLPALAELLALVDRVEREVMLRAALREEGLDGT